MRNIIVVADKEPKVKRIWSSYMTTSARIEDNTLTANLRGDIKLVIEAIDPQMVADILMSHDPSSEIVTGRIGIKSVEIIEKEKSTSDTKSEFIKALKNLINEIDG